MGAYFAKPLGVNNSKFSARSRDASAHAIYGEPMLRKPT